MNSTIRFISSSVKVGRRGTLAEILVGPAHDNDGTLNLFGALRTSMATTGYETVNFTASDSVGCFPFPVTLTDKSSVSDGAISSWQWDFGDGNTSTAQTPTHTYTSTGNYTVTLKTTSDKGCARSYSKPQYIQIASGVLADFDFTPTVNSCSAPLEINFNNRSVESGTVSYLWDFGDGQTAADKDPRHVFTANGSYTVTLMAVNSSGCRDTVRKSNAIVLGNTLTQFNIPGSICAGQSFFAINTSSSIVHQTPIR
jgi:PKD repeat protein